MENNIYKDYVDLTNELSKLVSQMSENLKNDSNKFWEEYYKHESRISENTKEALIILGRKGWYLPSLSNAITFHVELAEELLAGNETFVDKQLCAVIRKEFNSLCKEILNYCPSRRAILLSSFKAHKNKEYALSIPVFLAQADGICKEKINLTIFSKLNDGLPETKRYVEIFKSDSLIASFLEPFQVILPISYSKKQRDIDIPFNRHQILHGESINYNTELNSYKSFSFLSYVCTILKASEKYKDAKQFIKPTD